MPDPKAAAVVNFPGMATSLTGGPVHYNAGIPSALPSQLFHGKYLLPNQRSRTNQKESTSMETQHRSLVATSSRLAGADGIERA
ncbi:MAG: hypothetical protein ACJ8G3_06610 [Burkholderiaceae bacterium]